SHQQTHQAFIGGALHRTNHAAQHQHQPEGDARELANLPEATQIDVFVTLMTQPEVPLRRHDLRNGQIITDEGANHYHHQGPEQDIHTEFLIFRVLATVNE